MSYIDPAHLVNIIIPVIKQLSLLSTWLCGRIPATSPATPPSSYALSSRYCIVLRPSPLRIVPVLPPGLLNARLGTTRRDEGRCQGIVVVVCLLFVVCLSVVGYSFVDVD